MSMKIQKRGGVIHNGHEANGAVQSNCGTGNDWSGPSHDWSVLPESTTTTCKKCQKQADKAESLGLHLAVVKNENGSSRVVDTRAETVAEQAAYIEEGIEIDEAAVADEIAITKYNAHAAIATAAFGDGSTMGGHITRGLGGRWALMYGPGYVVRAKTLDKVAKQWAKRLGLVGAKIDVSSMS